MKNRHGTMFTILVLAFATAAPLAGCSSESAGGPGGASGGMPREDDLFACGLAPSCSQLLYHLGPLDSPDAAACAGKIVTSNGSGVISDSYQPGGPYTYLVEGLTILLGDGTAIHQTRRRQCDGDAPPCPDDLDDLPWEPPSRQERCDVMTDQACAQNDNVCLWSPTIGLENCSATETHTCADVEMALAGAGGT